ncbi:hypothetical protein C9374_010682 [Naegleria lovaniensis]|uniref:Endonuclease/exonuclease/phosphatase domain-containing protein n=1 Tax=Naegleria lovaniensis TaxID=51637 RepID=A0AA88GGB0_NAELO|nr:uncharacterized protein C9374_010682 [Naegleria lovaniensis]KAG2374663.1 hypothetical protein C9374_010682 [Naegleria lovaniensis]
MSQREEGKTVFSFSSSSSYQEDDSTGRMSGARRIAVTSRWLDDTVSSGNSSPVGSPVINHMVVVDEIHDVKVEVLEAGLHSRGASSSFDSKIDEQFGKIERKKQRINVVSWSATNDWCSKVCHDDNDDSDEDEDERMDDQQHVNNTNRRKRSTLQKLGEMAPDLILLQDLNYEQTMKAMKYLTKAEEHLHDEYDGNEEDLEPPVYKWFCCGHKHTSEPVKVSKSCNSDDDDEGVPSSLISPLASMGGNQSIISALLKNDVKKKIEADQDPDDLVNEYLPIIYNSETLKCVDCGAFWYSKTPQEAGSKSWDSTVPRFCNWGAFIFKPYDEEDDHIDLLVFNTHWDQGVEARRYASILLRQEVLNRMSVYNAITNRTTFIPTIIGGNLNSLPRSNALSILVQGQDLGAHNSDVNLLADSDDDDDDDEQVEKIDKESLIIPCQRQLMPPQAAGTTLQKSATVKKEDDKDFVKIEEESEEEEASDASSESYSGTWFHNLNLQPTFVDFETNTFETVDYLFVSPCVKTMNLQILDSDLSCGETHKPHVATLEM